MFIVKTTLGEVKIDYDEFEIAKSAFENQKEEDAIVYLRNGMVNSKYIGSIVPDDERRKEFLRWNHKDKDGWKLDRSVSKMPDNKKLDEPKS